MGIKPYAVRLEDIFKLPVNRLLNPLVCSSPLLYLKIQSSYKLREGLILSHPNSFCGEDRERAFLTPLL